MCSRQQYTEYCNPQRNAFDLTLHLGNEPEVTSTAILIHYLIKVVKNLNYHNYLYICFIYLFLQNWIKNAKKKNANRLTGRHSHMTAM